MKRMTAKEILAGSLRELAAHTPVDKITIQEIVDNCGYSPATFYRQFRDKYDLIAWDYCQSLGTIMNQIGKNGYVWKQTLLEGMRYFGSQREYICNLLRHTSGHDSFLMHMAAKHIEMLSKEVLRKTGENVLNAELAAYVKIYCYGTVSLVCEWLMDVFEMSEESMAELLEKALPEPLRPFLCES